MQSQTPSRGQLWEQAYAETRHLASFFRGNACRDRFEELLRTHGHINARAQR